ncbi:MAG: hypothetical protein ACYTGW_19775 [Planctomycetota bacterium]|jgi:hypothetical protein
MGTSPVMLALAVLTAGGYGMAQKPDLHAGQDLWRSCSACHCVPDLRIPEDENWLSLNNTTTCISGEMDTPAMRANLNAYLRSEDTLRPVLIDENYEPPAQATCGKIRVPSTAGNAYLKSERESIRKGSPPKIRLAWKASAKGKTLVLPVGQYRVISYSFHRPDSKSDSKKQTWSVSGTSAEGCLELAIESGKQATFDLRPEIQGHLNTKADKGNKGKWMLGFFMTNRGGTRMSISCDGRLVNPEWVIKGAGEKIVEQGDFEVT